MTPDKRAVVLVVDDDILFRFVVAETLRDAGCDVIEAVDAAEAGALLKSGLAVDLMLIEAKVPGSAGLVPVATLRGLRPGLPVVLVSGVAVAEDAVTSGRVTAMLRKPFRGADLVDLVTRVLGRPQ